MKNKLSNSHNGLALSERSESKGFTLVELLVVITILAILSTLAMIIYSSVQGRGRDTVRRAQVDNIANAIESKRLMDGRYKFNLNDFRKEFSNASDYVYDGRDPQGFAYCIFTAAGSTDTPDPLLDSAYDDATWTNGGDNCPDDWPTLKESLVGGALNGGVDRSWTLCSRIESVSNSRIYCRSSLTR